MDAELFCVRNGEGKIMEFENGERFFSEKGVAKAHRDWCRDQNSKGTYHVSPGPDHWRSHNA